MLTSLILGAIVGAVLGLTGAGGGILAVPALVAGMGWPMQQATPVALVAVAGSAPVVYHVTARSIVAPSAVQILQPTNDVRLTVFTCWPNWVDTQRVVVTATPATA